MVQPERCRQRDVDVAVWIDPDKADLRLPLRLANALEDGLGGKPVDVVVLNRAGQLLQYEVRRTGRLVFDRDPESRKILEIRARKRFEDFLYLHRRYAGAMLYGNRNGQTTSR
jgi:predicted nucleotidyltransferase